MNGETLMQFWMSSQKEEKQKRKKKKEEACEWKISVDKTKD